ncbi:MAG: DUF1489 family protein [Alphaproteobacteria bacterium]|nr:DUF1489 family protein [Alphaproteobacteria bacterium]
MTVHIIKLCVGADSVDDLAAWQAQQIKKRGRPVCGTRMAPKREADVLAGGSLYWVIKGVVAVRQRIVEISQVRDDHGLRCGLWLDPKLVRVTPHPRRAFQGWRYLEPNDAPADLSKRAASTLPEDLQRKLVELGAW